MLHFLRTALHIYYLRAYVLCSALACLTLLLSSLHALESQPLKVLRVIDGDSIVVEGSAGGVAIPISVRLTYIDTPEMRNGKKSNPHGVQAKKYLQTLLTKKTRVTLYTSGNSFRADPHGRVLAIVFMRQANTRKKCIQTAMINAGMSVYWQRYGNAKAPFHNRWAKEQRNADQHNQGLWRTQRTWMHGKHNE